jgi:hypothetical protein
MGITTEEEDIRLVDQFIGTECRFRHLPYFVTGMYLCWGHRRRGHELNTQENMSMIESKYDKGQTPL